MQNLDSTQKINQLKHAKFVKLQKKTSIKRLPQIATLFKVLRKSPHTGLTTCMCVDKKKQAKKKIIK